MAFWGDSKDSLELEKEKLKQLELKYLNKLEADKRKEKIRQTKEEQKRVYDAIKRKGLFDIKGIIRVLKEKIWKSKVMLINMELANGFHTQFLIKTKEGYFHFKEGTYILDDEFRYYSISSKMYCLDFHEDLPIPIQRRVNVGAIDNALREKGVTDVDNALNPRTLRKFMLSEFVQKVMQGQELDKTMKFLKYMTALGLVVGVLNLLILLQSSGILSRIRGG